MAIVFVTWKLEGTAPEPERKWIKKEAPPRRVGGPFWLADPRIAQIVVEALNHGAQSGRYDLLAWAIMPNHVHLVMLPKQPLSKAINWLKSATANRANRILGRTGEPFWMREYYDRWMRTDAEISKTIAYVEDNPVRAGLASSPKDYRWSSAAADKIGGGTKA